MNQAVSDEQPVPSVEPEPPFPESLCHRCAAPPRYVRTARSVFIFCPVLRLYLRQPLLACDSFRPREGGAPPPVGENSGS